VPDDQEPPGLRRLGRREALAIGLGAFGAAATFGGVLVARRRHSRREPEDDTPVRNPAYVYGRDERGRHYVLSGLPDGTVAVYRLNRAAHAVWDCCLAPQEYVRGRRRAPGEVLSRASARLGRDLGAEGSSFLDRLSEAGLVFLPSRGQVVYYARRKEV
jgi:hypothetical protein